MEGEPARSAALTAQPKGHFMRPASERTGSLFQAREGLVLVLALLLWAPLGCARSSPAPPAPAPPRDAPAGRTAPDKQANPSEPPVLMRDQGSGDREKKPSAPKEYWGKVLRVVDGATFSLDTHQVVRLIGVEAPKPAAGKAYREFFERVTTPAVRSLVEGKRVRLMRDKVTQGRDRMPRVYLYLEDKTLLNATLIQKGYARVSLEIPFKLQDEFKLWEREAQNIGLGVWAKTGG